MEPTRQSRTSPETYYDDLFRELAAADEPGVSSPLGQGQTCTVSSTATWTPDGTHDADADCVIDWS